ncbi:fimbrial protein [Citrobacter braakii]|uniref:F4 family fimbrial subunit n=1 Tax=Citrobacter braakii TaxID=57706 RepID=UPI002B246529|nr:fimbrial protein [Citrobacter braakii]MEB0968005.1 fimbrial protein [Citrobacter braakii]MEB0968009.1 fimbrial protein [Citrobacter braakii]
MKKIALFIAAVISAPALAWTNGDINKELNFGGTIKPEEYSQLWEWKVGTGLNDFKHNISDMDTDLKKLTIPVDSAKLLLTGRTKEALTGVSPGMGVLPQISFSDFQNTQVTLQDTGDTDTVFLELPIKDDTNTKIGMLRVNATAVAVSVGPFRSLQKFATTAHIATTTNSAFYGGLKTTNATGAGNNANNKLVSLGGTGRNELVEQVKRHPLMSDKNYSGFASNVVPFNLTFREENSNSTEDGLAAASYILAMANDQTMEATFDNPITATTKWSAPLNVAVTYN